jgi:ATP-binding cassette, subfamily B, bacterial PglK
MSLLGATFLRSSKLLSSRDKKILVVISVIQALLGILDLVGVGLIGLLGALSINGIQSRNAGTQVSRVLSWLHLENLEFQLQVAIIGAVAVLLLLCRTLLTVYFTRRTIYYLTLKSAHITGSIASGLFELSLLDLKKYSNQEVLYSLTFGVNSIMVGIIGTAVTSFADVSIFIIILSGLLFADFTLGMSALVLFVAVAVAIYAFQQKRAKHLGISFSKLNVLSEEKIVEALNSYREIKVHNRQQFYAREIEKIRTEIANIQAEMNFMPQVSKYVIETTLVVGTFFLAGLQFYLKDATHAVAALAIFMAAGTRIAPAVLRFQQGLVTIRTNLGSANPTLDLIDSVSTNVKFDTPRVADFAYENFEAKIELNNVSFTYGNSADFGLEISKLTIQEGSHVAIVGPSGSGKTTLADLILGVINPNMGEILVSNIPVSEAIRNWPGAVSYVPQDVNISNTSIRENIGLGYALIDIDQQNVALAASQAHLTELIEKLPNGTMTKLGERGGNISGGQRQRVGIARALYTKPRIIVLDEATSALDGETELNITETFKSLGEKTTLITIAHRLSTVRDADVVVYLQSGKIISSGTFQEVRDAVPDFDRQANLMGLENEQR